MPTGAHCISCVRGPAGTPISTAPHTSPVRSRMGAEITSALVPNASTQTSPLRKSVQEMRRQKMAASGAQMPTVLYTAILLYLGRVKNSPCREGQ